MLLYKPIDSFDFTRFRPEVFCIETLTYSEDQTGQKNQGIYDVMKQNDYVVYADTNLNTIFVDEKTWLSR
jgi:hypothetical protein